MNAMDSIAILIILALFSYKSDCIPEKECDRIQLDSKWYNKEVLWSHIGRPFNLNVHKSSNTLFFSFSVLETYSDVNFQLAYYSIDTKDYSVIAGILDGCAVTIDQKNDDIYLGGSDGIYKFNMVTKIADFYKEKGRNIWGLFYKHNLFYIKYPEQQLFMGVDEKFAKVREFENIQIDYFTVSNEKEIIYSNKTGLYRFNNTSGNVRVINDLLLVRQITEDINGKLYICSNIGLFIYENGHLEKILDIKNIHGITFDRDNTLILSNEKCIFKLIESNTTCINEIEESIREW